MNCTALGTPPRHTNRMKLSDRWAWAYSLPVGGIARAVAGCIAFHSHDSTGLSWPGMGKIAEETGFGRTAIIAAIKVLEQGGHLTVRRFPGRQKERGEPVSAPADGECERKSP